MRISHKHKFVYIAITKTGSSTICNTLNEYSDIRFNKSHNQPNMGASELKKKFDMQNWNWEEYFKFTFVRNPWERIVSQWEYRHKQIHKYESEKYNTGRDFPIRCKELLTELNFDFNNFILYLAKNKTTGSSLVCDQRDWSLDDKKDKSLLNFIGKTENLQEDFNTVCDKIGIPEQQLPHRNKTKHKHYTEYYDDETREIVAEKYAKDIEYFGYEFGE